MMVSTFLGAGRLDRHCTVNEDASNPCVDEACMLMDITFSDMRYIRISSMEFYTTLMFSDMHARCQIAQVGEKTLNVTEWVASSQ
jgi:hypothetical protein